MPRCPRCRRWCDGLKEYAEHQRSHRRPTRKPKPEIHKCQNCGRVIPSPFSHWNRCP